MRDACFDVLCEVAFIASRAEPDCCHACKDILRLLQKTFSLARIELLLCDSGRRHFVERMTDAGSELFGSCTLAIKEPMATALSTHRPLRKGRLLLLPLPDLQHAPGILLVALPAAVKFVPSQEKLFETVARQLDCLLRRRAANVEAWRQRSRLELVSELGNTLNEAESLSEMLVAAGCVMQRHTRACGVFFRPIYGGTVLGDCVECVAEGSEKLGGALRAVEERFASQVLAEGRLLADEFVTVMGDDGRSLTLSAVAAPLVTKQTIWGLMTLFEPTPGAPLALSSDPPARKLLLLVMEQVAQAMERISALEKLAELSRENAAKLEEISLLYRMSRAMHSTLQVDELMHLVLSAATVEGGAGFERAMLFMVNERSGFLQGMLGVTTDGADVILPADRGLAAWDDPQVGIAQRAVQRETSFCREVCSQRLSLEETDHPLVKAVQQRRVLLIQDHEQTAASYLELKNHFAIGHCVCAPLVGRNRVLGVLLVDSPREGETIDPGRRRFLDLFANQAAQALENSLLLQRLEESHRHLRETQEQMIQGEKMAALGETAASVTHELRNPLVSVGGYAHRLSGMFAENSKAGQYSQIIVHEVCRMEEMLNNILAFSRRQMLCLAPCRLEEILQEVLILEAELLQRASIVLRQEIDGELPVLQGDEQKLRQVLLNLFANARQVMSTGGVLTLRLYNSQLRGDPAVTLEVEDTGGGIDPAVLRNIFNPFFTTRKDGTGLGLSIVHRIIEHHFGDIEVQNGERGALFTLRLPVAQQSCGPGRSGRSRSKQEAGSKGGAQSEL